MCLDRGPSRVPWGYTGRTPLERPLRVGDTWILKAKVALLKAVAIWVWSSPQLLITSQCVRHCVMCFSFFFWFNLHNNSVRWQSEAQKSGVTSPHSQHGVWRCWNLNLGLSATNYSLKGPRGYQRLRMFPMHETVKNKPDTRLSRIITVLTIQVLAKLSTDTPGSYCSPQSHLYLSSAHSIAKRS